MLGSEECLRRAAEMERLAAGASDADLRAEFLKVAADWRDMARRVEEKPRRDDDA